MRDTSGNFLECYYFQVQGGNVEEPNNNKLGLHVVDEPAARQTDQSVLELQLRQVIIIFYSIHIKKEEK